MAKNKKRLKVLSLKEIDKRYGTTSMASAILVENDRSLRIPSRCPWLTWQLGGGLPYGKITEIFGYQSTGKSLLAMDFGVVTQQLGGIVIWADAEQCFDMLWAKQVGMDLDKLYIFDKTNAIEKISDWIKDMVIATRSMLTNNEPILVVIDSIAALDTDVNVGSEQTDKKAQMGNRAKAIGDMWRYRNSDFHQYGATVIAINQIRKKLGVSMFESDITQPGGEATKFYSSIRISINRGKQIKGIVNSKGFREDSSGVKFGQNVFVGIDKNKTAPPRNNIKTQVYFLPDIYGYVGYSKYGGMADILISHGILDKKGNAYVFTSKGEEIKLCGKYDDIDISLENNPTYRKKLLKKLGVNLVSTTDEKLKSLGKNMYPVIGTVDGEEED